MTWHPQDEWSDQQYRKFVNGWKHRGNQQNMKFLWNHSRNVGSVHALDGTEDDILFEESESG
jgi:hypothetical protein